ncbi:unnamed protein product [Parnassius apollo]|uniref:(apollo) hypothetical protein n=1 Tax=Parnassius apollo TaxID=110799 RepID=A0A8S3WGG3_PARAO|nr:unnamed protein product [Parnassius apollo]
MQTPIKNKPTEAPTPVTMNIEKQEPLVELTDDNSPSILLTEENSNQQGTMQESRTLMLNMQVKTQEKIKLNQKPKEVTEKTIEEGKKKENQEKTVTNKESNKPDANPEKTTTPATKVIPTNDNIKTIPTLNNRSSATRTSQGPKWPQNNYQNVQQIQDTIQNEPNIQQSSGMREPQGSMVPQHQYQNIYQFQDAVLNDPNIQMGNIPPPKGIPLTFLKRQQRFGAIEPQQDYDSPMAQSSFYAIPDQSTFAQQPITDNFEGPQFGTNTPMFVQTEMQETMHSQVYSPSDLFTEGGRDESNKVDEDIREGSASPDNCQPGEKRLSAFKRLGPLTQPKKPKLTINLSFDKEQPIREVVGDNENDLIPEIFVPVHKRQDILTSTDEVVVKYLPNWPWKNNVVIRRGVTARSSKSAMLMEQEQMEEVYEKDNLYVQVSVKGYPNTWRKEHVLDALLEAVKGKSFIPCFIEFTPHECKFLVIRCRPALVAIHKLGFCVRKDDFVLTITISKIDLTLKLIEFLPKLILRKRLSMGYDSERKLSLKEFTLQWDVSHFIYFPLNRLNNQADIVGLQSAVEWKYLTDLDLSNNRLTSLDGFDLQRTTPKLQNLDISNNYFEKITPILQCRELPLKVLKLEGNPLCTDYTDPQYYVRVLKMIFPMLREIDGMPLVLKGELPLVNKNFCPGYANDFVEKFLGIYFPIIDSPPDDRAVIEEMYAEDALLTITYRQKLCLTSIYRLFRNLFLHSRNMSKNIKDFVRTPKNITKLLKKWPSLEHDPTTFTVDVMWHTETSTVLRISGIVKITSDSLAVDEHMLAFTRTILLHTDDGVEYKIRNEMLYWDQPTEEYSKNAFRINVVSFYFILYFLHQTVDIGGVGPFIYNQDMEVSPILST